MCWRLSATKGCQPNSLARRQPWPLALDHLDLVMFKRNELSWTGQSKAKTQAELLKPSG